MRKGKYQSKGTKIVVLMLAMMLVFGCAMGGTLAYLVTSSGPVTNTFTVGDINIELKEHKLKGNGDFDTATTTTNTTDYKVLPGTEQKKDPFVIVKAKSEACWLFVKVEDKNNTVNGKTLVTYTVKNAATTEDPTMWKVLDATNYPGVYYMEVEATGESDHAPIYVLAGNQVSYNKNLEKADLSSKPAPQLIFNAYAVQKEAGTSAAAAWAASGFAGTSQG